MLRKDLLAILTLAFASVACGSSDGNDDNPGGSGSGGSGATAGSSGSSGNAGSGGSGATAGGGGTGAPDCEGAFLTLPVPYTANTSIEEWGGFAVDEQGAVFTVIGDTTLADDAASYNAQIWATDLSGNLSTLNEGSDGNMFGQLVLHGDQVYVLAGLLSPGIARLPRAGGELTAVVDTTVTAGPVKNEDFLYYGAIDSEAGLYRLDLATDTPTLLGARGDVEIVTLDVDGDTLYWIESDGFLEETDYRLFSMPRDGGTAEMLASLPRDTTAIGEFRVIDGIMFGSEISLSPAGVQIQRSAIGEPPTVVEDSGGVPMVMVDGNAYYGSNNGLIKAPLSFASKTVVPGTDDLSIYSIAVGPDDLWYSHLSCVYRTAK